MTAIHENMQAIMDRFSYVSAGFVLTAKYNAKTSMTFYSCYFNGKNKEIKGATSRLVHLKNLA